MKTLKFKTNLKCGGCVDSIRPALDGDSRISEWNVDIVSPDKVLTVRGEEIDTATIIALLAASGYEAKPIQGFFKKVFG